MLGYLEVYKMLYNLRYQITNPGISDGPTADKNMTPAKLSRTGYIISNNRIEPITYGDYLREYWSEEVTSPRGVEPALFIQEGEEGLELRKWIGSRSTLVNIFQSKEEAEMELYASWEYDYLNGSTNAPLFEESYEHAIEVIAERNRKSPAVIHRYLAMQALADKAAAIRRQEYEKEREAFQQAIIAEATEITPDEQLLQEVRAAKKLTSNEEKTKALSVAQVAFLHRIGHYPIRTDFWRVFKIVNKKPIYA